MAPAPRRPVRPTHGAAGPEGRDYVAGAGTRTGWPEPEGEAGAGAGATPLLIRAAATSGPVWCGRTRSDSSPAGGSDQRFGTRNGTWRGPWSPISDQDPNPGTPTRGARPAPDPPAAMIGDSGPTTAPDTVPGPQSAIRTATHRWVTGNSRPRPGRRRGRRTDPRLGNEKGATRGTAPARARARHAQNPRGLANGKRATRGTSQAARGPAAHRTGDSRAGNGRLAVPPRRASGVGRHGSRGSRAGKGRLAGRARRRA